jgi:hypothetical protein
MARYVVPPQYRSKFTPDEVEEFRRNFALFDANGDGTIDTRELETILRNIGEPVTADRLHSMIAEVDLDGSNSIDFGEFCAMMDNIREGRGEAAMVGVVKKAVKLLTVEGAGGASHTFSEEEKIAFSEHINNCLGSDPHLSSHLPVDPQSMDLFPACSDGLIFCKLINLAVADTIDERALNTRENMNVYQKTENQNLAINAAKAIGCQVTNIGAADLIEARPILILGLIWQIIKIQLLSSISLKNCPELVLLLQEGEDLDTLLKLPPEEILLRWFNYHLAAANHPRRVTNFGRDLQDSECYSALLHQLAPSQCDICTESDPTQRAAHVIRNSRNIGVDPFIQPTDIVKANKKLNLGFVAQLFNTMPGLHMTQEQLAEYDFATLDLDDAGDSREERVFRMWINSLNIDGLYINDLFADLTDGVALLKIMDRVQPGVVSWRRVNMDPKSKFKKVENANYAVVIGKQMRFVLVNVGGPDIVDKNKKLILAIVWQLMRRHTISMLAQLSSEVTGRELADEDIVNWANRRVRSSGKASSMSSFRDPNLCTARFLIDLCAAIEPRAVNWDLVTAGANDADALSNAKYAISIARKLGACVFLAPEDITEVKSKMIMTFVASLWLTDLETSRGVERK